MHEVTSRSLGHPARALHWLAGLFFGLALVFAIVAWTVGDVFFFRLGTEALIFAGLALSVDLLLGRTGLLPLGQALFFGMGAYVSALVLKNWSSSFWIAIAVALVFSAITGLIGGLIAIRSKGVYFALISFGLAQVVSKIIAACSDQDLSDQDLSAERSRGSVQEFLLEWVGRPVGTLKRESAQTNRFCWGRWKER